MNNLSGEYSEEAVVGQPPKLTRLMTGRVVVITGWIGTRAHARQTVAVSFMAIVLLWTADVLEIIFVASRAFALYYLL